MKCSESWDEHFPHLPQKCNANLPPSWTGSGRELFKVLITVLFLFTFLGIIDIILYFSDSVRPYEKGLFSFLYFNIGQIYIYFIFSLICT